MSHFLLGWPYSNGYRSCLVDIRVVWKKLHVERKRYTRRSRVSAYCCLFAWKVDFLWRVISKKKKSNKPKATYCYSFMFFNGRPRLSLSTHGIRFVIIEKLLVGVTSSLYPYFSCLGRYHDRASLFRPERRNPQKLAFSISRHSQITWHTFCFIVIFFS